MNRQFPPFSAIRAFEAAARHLSFKLAADEISVTPSAISHQIKSLEEYLGRALFVRDGNHLSLSSAGSHYLNDLTGLLDRLDHSTKRASNRAPGRPLRILTTPAFAARWLVPRLARFRHCADVSIRVSNGAPCTDFTRNDADVILHWGDSNISGVTVCPLMESGRFPVVSPEFQARAKIKHPQDLLNCTLIRDDVMDAWVAWFKLNDITANDLPNSPSFPHCELAMVAAENDQGVVLAYDAMVRTALEGGRLVRLFNAATLPVTIYSFACSDSRVNDPKIADLRDWLNVEAHKDGFFVGHNRARETTPS